MRLHATSLIVLSIFFDLSVVVSLPWEKVATLLPAVLREEALGPKNTSAMSTLEMLCSGCMDAEALCPVNVFASRRSNEGTPKSSKCSWIIEFLSPH